MDEGRFWDIIAKAGGDGDTLVELLAGQSAADIIAFEHLFGERVRDAFRWDLWAVAYIMNGGCSDDGFDYFLSWLIARGREVYAAALADPERAADGVDPDDEPFENDLLWWAPARAYARVTGKDELYEHAQGVTRTIQGEPWDEDEVYELYPRLAERFG